MNLNTLIEISNEMYKRTRIPISCFNLQKELIFSDNSIVQFQDKNFNLLFDVNNQGLQIAHNDKLLIASFLIEIDAIKHFIIVGPCILLGSNQDVNINLRSYISNETLDTFISYCKSIFSLFTHKNLQLSDILTDEIVDHHDSLYSKKFFEEILYSRRSNLATKDSYELELRYIDYVNQGKKEKIDWLLKKFSENFYKSDPNNINDSFNNGSSYKLSDNRLEDLKLKFTALVTLMTRTSITNGVPLDLAFSLSDSLIYTLKNINSQSHCIDFIRFATFEFIDLIKKYKTSQYSKCISQCISYIDAHIYEKIYLEDVAEYINRSPSYLSSRFKQEVGKTFKSFILNKKIDETKRLLLFTDQDYQQISLLLNFTSQSHFIHCFKKTTGETPKAYRTKHTRYA